MWYKLKRILIYPDGVTEKQVYPAWWKPWANTIAYYPLETDTNDYSWNGRNLTNSWITFSWWFWNFNWNSYWYINNGSLLQWTYTVNFWYRKNISWWNTAMDLYNNNLSDNSYNSAFMRIALYSGGYEEVAIANWTSNTTWAQSGTGAIVSGILWWNWYNIVGTFNQNILKIYANWVLLWTKTISWTYTPTTYFAIGRWYNWVYPLYWQISRFIIEDKEWTQNEITEDYNQTKSNYWL